MDIELEVRQVVAAELGTDVTAVTAGTAAGNPRTWDSVKTVTILASVQKHFGIEIPDEDLFELVSVGAIADEVAKLKGTP